MRTFKHLTLRYIRDRFRVIRYEKKFPDEPWLSKTANEVLNDYIMESDIGLEFGSGRSTRWFAKRMAHLTTVEHDEEWGEIVKKMLQEENISNVDYHLYPENVGEEGSHKSSYVGVIDSFADCGLDFCLVDGSYRDHCSLRVLKKIKPGGILVIDNVNWFLSSSSVAPNTRSFEQGPNGPVWEQVDELISGWRRIWTSSGVTDTAIFFKPHD